MCGLSGILTAQLQCVNYDTQDGLDTELTRCATEDNHGYMWFGTGGGVYKLLGDQFINYSQIGEGNYPGNIPIKCITTDNRNNIWIGTEDSGLYKYDQSGNKWTHFGPNEKGKNHISGNEIMFVKNIIEDKLYFSGNGLGLGCVDLGVDSVIIHDISDQPNYGTWSGLIYDIEADPNRNDLFWFTAHRTLMSIDLKSGKISSDNIVAEDKSHKTWTSFQIFENGDKILASYDQGIYLLKDGERIAKSIHPEEFADDKWISSISETKDELIWATMRNKGFASYDIASGIWKTYKSSPNHYHGLLPGKIHELYQSKDGSTWVMTNQGISLIIEQRQNFKFYDRAESANFFMDVVYDSSKNEYYTAYSGLNGSAKIFDDNLVLKQSQNTIGYTNEFNAIYSIFQNSDNEIYLNSGKVYEYKNNIIVPVVWPGYDNKKIVVKITEDGESLILLHPRGGITIYNRQKKESTFIPFNKVDASDPAFDILFDIDKIGDDYWIAAQSQLIIYSIKTSTNSYYKIEDGHVLKKGEEDDQSTKNSISQIIPIDNNCAWVLMRESGLLKICQDSNDDLIVEEKRGAAELSQLQTSRKMLRGSADDYWITTKNGLINADRELENFKVINKNFGLSYPKLDHGFGVLNGKLFIGMDSGFAVAEESNLLQSLSPQVCDINNPKLGNIDLVPSEVNEVNYKYKSFHVQLTSPIYDEVASVMYSYQLIGHSEEPTIVKGADHMLRFDNLSPGSYRFEAKVKSQNREWGEVKSIDFEILSPIWKRWWFLLSSTLALGYLVYKFYQNRIKNIQSEADIKTQLVELEKQALHAQMNPHFIFNALNSIRSLILIGRYEESTEYLTKFSNMVRKILQYSSDSTITLSEEVSFLNDYISLEKLRFSVKFDYKISIDENLELDAIRIPPLLVQPFVENAIWHGLLHKQSNASLFIKISSDNDLVRVVVSDNGIGRKASRKMTSSSGMKTKKEVGFKLGKKRIELLGAKAELQIIDLVENEVAIGTKVIISIPKMT